MASTSSSSIQAAAASVVNVASAVNVINFVTKKLHFSEYSNNYRTWREQMLCLTESQGMLGFLNGEVAPPPSPEQAGKIKSQDYAAWRRNDRLVKGWILGALSDELVPKCIEYDSARDVWLELEQMFTRSKRGPPPPPVGQDRDYYEYLELYKAALRGDWDKARSILDSDTGAAKARLVFTLETALHIAVGTGKALGFVENLVGRMTDDDLALENRNKCTALHIAGITGNTAAARILVARLPALLYMPSRIGRFPIHEAARSAHKETLEYLISQTTDPSAYADTKGVLLLCLVIDADFYDIALRLVDKYPHLARMKLESNHSALLRLSLREFAFPSGARFNLWERLIYSSIDLRESEATPQSSDIEAGRVCLELRKWYKVLLQKWQFLLIAIDEQVAHGRTRTKKLMHHQAIKLVKCLCKNMLTLNDETATSIYNSAMMTAARLGIHEVIQEIVETFPDAVYCKRNGHYFFQVAAENRSEKVFNLIYQTRDHKHQYSNLTDSSDNTVLHLVARLAPPHKLNLVSGAALQMQRELQWFKKVEYFVHPYAREQVNDDGKTPKMVFTEEHKNLKVDGEKWMKDTASSCIITATLIATVVFAAGITVPGGNNSISGYPVLNKSSAFIVFAISDAGSLFTSITSLLMFLSIMTSRYAEEDFLSALPNRLSIGLFTLFVSIFFMMVAFSASTYLVLGHQQKWVLIPVAALACLPIASFVLLQFPLLVDVISSTYGRGVFGKQTDPNPFY